jgi:hypothetical protein
MSRWAVQNIVTPRHNSMSRDTFADAFLEDDAPADQEDFLNNLMGFISSSTFDAGDLFPALPDDGTPKSKTNKK